MKTLAKSALLGGFVLLAVLSRADAKIVIGDSLDWLVVSHEHAAVVAVARIQDAKPASPVWMERTFHVQRKKSLRGMPPERTRFSRHVAEKEAQPPIGTEFLVFFNGAMEIDYAIDLSSPPGRGWREVALDMDFNVLKTRKTILDAVQARLAKLERERPVGFLRLAVPDDKPAYRALWSGSACFLRVPADPGFKTKFIGQLGSNDVRARATAAYWLVKFPGKDAVEALMPLLQDPGAQVIQTYRENQRRDITVYPVRQAAYRTLAMWEIEVPQPPGYYPDYPASFLE